MPAKLRAGGGFPFILPDDLANGETQPQFIIRILSMDEDIEIATLRQEYIAATDLNKRKEIMKRALAIAIKDCLIGDILDIASSLTTLECWQVINAATEGATLTAEQRKKFALLPSSATEKSVGDAAVASAVTE